MPLLFPPLPQLPSNGADGRQPLPSHSDGAGPRATVLSAVPDAVRNQAPPLGGNHPQGRCSLASSLSSLTKTLSHAAKVALTEKSFIIS